MEGSLDASVQGCSRKLSSGPALHSRSWQCLHLWAFRSSLFPSSFPLFHRQVMVYVAGVSLLVMLRCFESGWGFCICDKGPRLSSDRLHPLTHGFLMERCPPPPIVEHLVVECPSLGDSCALFAPVPRRGGELLPLTGTGDGACHPGGGTIRFLDDAGLHKI